MADHKSLLSSVLCRHEREREREKKKKKKKKKKKNQGNLCCQYILMIKLFNRSEILFPARLPRVIFTDLTGVNEYSIFSTFCNF